MAEQDVNDSNDKFNNIKSDIFRSFSTESQKFYNFRVPEADPLTTGYNYIFFTKPNMSLTYQQYVDVLTTNKYIESIESNPDVFNAEKLYNNTARHLSLPIRSEGSFGDNECIYNDDIIKQLSGTMSGFFMPIFTNRTIKYSAIPTKIETIDYSETWNQNKIVLGMSDEESHMAGTFQLDLIEDNNLSMLKMHKLWIDYIKKVALGDIQSTESLKVLKQGATGFFNAGFIDYMVSAYHITTLPDARTIQYWAKYTGVFPNNIPWDLFTTDDGSVNIIPSVNIEYQYSYKEEMDPALLSDFNRVSNGEAMTFNMKNDEYNNFKGSKNNPIPTTGNNLPRIVRIKRDTQYSSSPIGYQLILEG